MATIGPSQVSHTPLKVALCLVAIGLLLRVEGMPALRTCNVSELLSTLLQLLRGGHSTTLGSVCAIFQPEWILVPHQTTSFIASLKCLEGHLSVRPRGRAKVPVIPFTMSVSSTTRCLKSWRDVRVLASEVSNCFNQLTVS